MADQKDNTPKNIKVELGGMGLYGTTSNEEIAGYKATGDIENAGQLDKFEKRDGQSGASPSVEGHEQRD